MSTQVQFRRGNTQQISAFTGAPAELIVDTDLHTITIQDGSTPGGWYLASKSFAQAAYDAANNAPNSTFVRNAYNQANAASNLAQVAFDSSNTKTSTALTQIVFNTANGAYGLAESAFIAANTAGSNITNYSANAYYQANVATQLASAAFALAMSKTKASTTQIVFDTANGAFSQANLAYNLAVSGASSIQTQLAFDQANLAYNLATSGASSIFTQQAYTHANSSYDQANAATTLAQTAFNLANSEATLTFVREVYRIANGASILANTIYELVTPEVSDAANSVIRIDGVNDTQNTNIADINTFAQSAYTQANNAVSKSGDTITGDLTINSGTLSTSNGSGSLLVSGGVGVTGNVSVSGYLNLSNTAGGQGGHIIYNQDENSIDFMIF
jgi:hypothetical protein